MNYTRSRWLVFLGFVVLMVGASAPSPFYPVFQAEIGFSAATLTLIYAFYVLVLLIALLTLGSLSDHIGRRPVLVVAYLFIAGSMVLLAVADSVGDLLIARGVQGFGAALGMTTAGAALVDFEDPARPGNAALLNGITPLIGMAIGGLTAGLALQILAEPQLVMFGGLATLAVIGAILLRWVPESSPRTEGGLATFVPRVRVPAEVRTDFLRGLPAIIACWSTGAFFLSLGAPVVADVLNVPNRTVQGSVITALMTGGAVACVVLQRRGPRLLTLFGTLSLAVGTAASLVALEMGSVSAYLVAVFIAGTGFGAGFLGVLQSLLDRANPLSRGELFTAIFVACYLAFSLPALVAGWLEGQIGLNATTTLYGSFVVVLGFTAWSLRRFTTRL